MAALTKQRNTPWRTGEFVNDPVAATTVIFAGALVCLDASGNAVPGSTSTTLTARGVAQHTVDNTSGAAGAEHIECKRGVFRFNNSAAADEVTRAEIGSECFIADDNTVAKTNGESSRSGAGIVVDVDDSGVWVEIR